MARGRYAWLAGWLLLVMACGDMGPRADLLESERAGSELAAHEGMESELQGTKSEASPSPPPVSAGERLAAERPVEVACRRSLTSDIAGIEGGLLKKRQITAALHLALPEGGSLHHPGDDAYSPPHGERVVAAVVDGEL